METVEILYSERSCTKYWEVVNGFNNSLTKLFFCEGKNGVFLIQVFAEVNGEITHSFLYLLDLFLFFLGQVQSWESFTRVKYMHQFYIKSNMYTVTYYIPYYNQKLTIRDGYRYWAAQIHLHLCSMIILTQVVHYDIKEKINLLKVTFTSEHILSQPSLRLYDLGSYWHHSFF